MSSLIEIQNELKAPKNQRNTFGKYNYRSAEDILEAVKPILAKHKAVLTLSDKSILVGDWHYIETTATFKCGDEVFIVTASAREAEQKKGMDSSQITGTASSYARKYALNGLFLIDDTKDSDTDEYFRQTNNTPKKTNNNNTLKKIQQEDVNRYKTAIQKLIEQTGKNDGSITKWFLGHLQVTKVEDIPINKMQLADELIRKLKDKKTGDKQ